MKDFIAVMDSGVGGISVLREMVKIMPQEDFRFFGDSANAPYGTKSTAEVRALVLGIVRRFLDEGAKAIAIACNTATSAAVKDLRELYPDVPLVGIEPALKPAVERHPGGRILVMATPMTIREEKFHTLLARYDGQADIIPLACPGLMEFVEAGKQDSDEVKEFLEELLRPYLGGGSSAASNVDEGSACSDKRGCDAVVLGCTHYPFVLHRIREVIGTRPEIFDGGEGTARELRRRLLVAGLLKEEGAGKKGEVVLTSSDPSPEKLRLSESLLAAEGFA